MKRFGACVIAAMALLVVSAGPAAALVSVQFGSTATVTPPNRSKALVPVSVSCHPGDQVSSSSGTFTVWLSQTQRSGTVTGSGSVDVICDNTVRDYLVPVTADAGVFLPGAASVRGELAWDFTICESHPEFGTECTTHRARSIHDEQPISIVYRVT